MCIAINISMKQLYVYVIEVSGSYNNIINIHVLQKNEFFFALSNSTLVYRTLHKINLN